MNEVYQTKKQVLEKAETMLTKSLREIVSREVLTTIERQIGEYGLKRKGFFSKERLVFSMINYDSIVSETWEMSSFLRKNKSLLLLFYLWVENQSILDYKFKFVH